MATIGIPVRKACVIEKTARPMYFDSLNSVLMFLAFQACQHAMIRTKKLINDSGAKNAAELSDVQVPIDSYSLFQ